MHILHICLVLQSLVIFICCDFHLVALLQVVFLLCQCMHYFQYVTRKSSSYNKSLQVFVTFNTYFEVATFLYKLGYSLKPYEPYSAFFKHFKFIRTFQEMKYIHFCIAFTTLFKFQGFLAFCE